MTILLETNSARLPMKVSNANNYCIGRRFANQNRCQISEVLEEIKVARINAEMHAMRGVEAVVPIQRGENMGDEE